MESRKKRFAALKRKPSVNACKKYCYYAGVGLFYGILSLSLAFLCHRIYFYDTPAIEVIKSIFAIIVFLLTFVGLITWTAFRVFVFLLIPKLFNVNGRAVLVAYISYLTLSGPVWNTTRNIGVMSTTLVCAFEELRKSTEELMELLERPVLYIKHLLDTMEARAKKIFAQLADKLRAIENYTRNMLYYFRKSIAFLKRLTHFCNDKLGTPAEYCASQVRETIASCEEVHDSTICGPLVTLYPMCAPLMGLQLFCLELNYTFLDVDFIEHMKEKFRQLHEELRTFVDVDVHIDGDFEVQSNKSKSYSKVVDEVNRKFEARTSGFLKYLKAMKIVSMVFSLYLFLTVYRFKYKYLNDVEYHNRYLLASFVEINKQRVKQGDESVFPLNYDEERYYIEIYSWRVTYWEVMQAIRGVSDVVGSCFYVLCVIFGDYALYYLMMVLTTSSNDDIHQKVVHVSITGTGFVADYMNAVVGTFTPIINGFSMDFGVCAPKPYPPNEDRTRGLFVLCGVSVLQAVIYPFAARLMHQVMARYYVSATRRRMIWLYHDIIRRRKTWQMLVQDRLAGTYGGDQREDPIPFIGYMRAVCGACSLGQWFLSEGGGREPDEYCTNCGKSLIGARAQVGYFKCPTYSCSAVYCRRCIRQLKWVCMLCKRNVNVRTNYGELQLEEGVDLKAF